MTTQPTTKSFECAEQLANIFADYSDEDIRAGVLMALVLIYKEGLLISGLKRTEAVQVPELKPALCCDKEPKAGAVAKPSDFKQEHPWTS